MDIPRKNTRARVGGEAVLRRDLKRGSGDNLKLRPCKNPRPSFSFPRIRLTEVKKKINEKKNQEWMNSQKFR